jgi:hypothetical protein
MIRYSLLFIMLITLAIQSCVQPAYRKTVVVMLTVKNNKDIQSVGIRGGGNPLSWDTDYPMQAVIKDSVYTATVTAVTGYKFAEIKFTVNGKFELEEKPNRRVTLSDKDTTIYNAVFNSNN